MTIEPVYFRILHQELHGVLVDRQFRVEGCDDDMTLVVTRSGDNVVFVALPPIINVASASIVPDADVVQAATQYLADKASKEARRARTGD